MMLQLSDLDPNSVLHIIDCLSKLSLCNLNFSHLLIFIFWNTTLFFLVENSNFYISLSFENS